MKKSLILKSKLGGLVYAFTLALKLRNAKTDLIEEDEWKIDNKTNGYYAEDGSALHR